MITGLLVTYGAQEQIEAKAMAEVLNGLSSGFTHQLSTPAKTLAIQFINYLNKELLPIFDALPANLDFLLSQDKARLLDNLAKTNLVDKWLAHLLTMQTTHQVQSSLANLVGRLDSELGRVTVKSPITPNVEFKANVRKHFKSDFVIFNTDNSLLGGLLVYRNSQLVDDSWLGKIKALSTI